LQWVAIGGITVSAALFSMGPQTNDAAASAAGETTAGQVGAGGVIASSESAAGPQNVQPSKSAPSLKDRLLGVAMCILSGIAMAALTVGIRKTVTGATSPLAVVFLINVMGVVVCAPWCIHSLGVAKIMSTPSHDFGVMLLTGAMNFAGFFLVTMGLKLLAVVSANVINNGLSSAMTAAVGILWLAEAYNTAIILGLVFSIGGTLLISLVAPPEEQPAAAGQLDSAAASP
jgi:drug/metabolite transporter (DMT)-like permease